MNYMKKYKIIPNKFGYLLENQFEKYVLYKTKKKHAAAEYYLKQVFPIESYVSGMFYDKKREYYYGRCIDGKRVIVKLGLTFAELTIQ